MIKLRPRLSETFLALSIGFLALASCDDAAILIGPDNQLEVTNAVDQFQFQVVVLDNVTDRKSYEWQNTGTQATIDVSQAIQDGTALLTIRDAVGSIMYSEDVGEDSDTTTPIGVAGSWQIEVVLTQSSGTFNFRVQKTT